MTRRLNEIWTATKALLPRQRASRRSWTDLFRVRKEERWFVGSAFLVLLLFQVLFIICKFDRFTTGAHAGFWTIFYNHLGMSGYDVFSYIAVSCLRVHFNIVRHPLYIAVLLPMYWLNSWLMETTGFNFTIFFIAALNLFCATYTALFLMRTLHEIVGAKRRDAVLLTALLFSFAHILIATIVPDHFVISLFLLTMTMYIAGSKMQHGERLSPLSFGILFTMTAGITLTNGVKTVLSLLFVNGRKALKWRFASAIVAFVIVCAAALELQERLILEPQSHKIQRIENALQKKNPNFKERLKAHNDWVKRQNGDAMAQTVPLLEWSDITTPRLRSAWDNLFGESLQLHRTHFLEDVQQTRPVFVSYKWTFSYVIEALVIVLLGFGVWCGRHSRLLWMVLSWTCFDMIMHFGFGFGLNEVYIMTAHWAFVIPIAIAFTLTKTRKRVAQSIRLLTVLLTVWMWMYNGFLIIDHLV